MAVLGLVCRESSTSSAPGLLIGAGFRASSGFGVSVGVRVGVRVRIGVPGQAVWISVRSPDHRVWKVPSLSIRLYVWAPKKSR